MVNSDQKGSLADQHADRKFVENLENRISHECAENEINKKNENSSKTPADSSAAASLKQKLKRKKLANKQAVPQLDFNCNSNKKKKCITSEEPRVPALILGKLDSMERFVKQNHLADSITINGSSACQDIRNEELKRRDVGTWVRSVAGATDSECLGCCEPGTSVTLEGIVWQETSAGVLVVNVTWRGKSYVGTLLDCTKSDWSAPRLCDSPIPDTLEAYSKGNGRGRHLKRNAGSSSALNKSGSNSSGGNSSKAASLAAATSAPPLSVAEPPTSSGGAAANGNPAGGDVVLEPSSPLLFECPLDGCEKKFGQIVALTYHQNSTHEFRASRRRDAATSTDPALIAAATAGNIGRCTVEKTSASGTGAGRLTAAKAKKQQLSEAEHESLENLFKVIGSSPNVNSSAIDRSIDRRKNHKVNDNSSGSLSSLSKTPPVLQTPDESNQSEGNGRVSNAHSPTAVFSDVSDVEDEAPTLERHSSPLASTLPSSSSKEVVASSVAKASASAINNVQPNKGDVESVGDKRSTDKAKPNSTRSLNVNIEALPSVSPFSALSHQSLSGARPSPSLAPHRIASPAAVAQAYCNSNNAIANGYGNAPFVAPSIAAPNPFFGLPPSAPPPSGVVAPLGLPPGFVDPTHAPAFFNAAPLPSPLAPGSAYRPVMTATMAPSRPPPYFGALPPNLGVILPPTSFFATPPPLPPAAPLSTTSHKIHELSDAKKPAASVTLPLKSSPSTVAGGYRKESSAAMTPDGSVVGEDARLTSPPVQRHHHLHHHTHSYPLLTPDPFTALYAGQQSATGVVCAFPPYSRK